jgi:hypothetical protein
MEPGEGPVFPYKSELLRAEPSPTDAPLAESDHLVSGQESLFLSYIDGELNATDRASVDELISRDPSKASVLRQLSMTVTKPDLSIVFPDKESLYRTERRRRMVPIFWMRAGVAAAVLGVGAMLFLDRPHVKESVATVPVAVPEKKDVGPVTPHTATPLYIEKKQVAQKVRQERLQKTEKPQAQDMAVVKTSPSKDRIVTSPVLSIDTGRDVVVAPTTKPDKTEALPVINAVAVSIPKEQSSFATQALLKESEDGEADNIVADAQAPSGKAKLRKIFRRVSRAFGKTADRDDDGQRQVLISAFQVALK